MKKTCTTCGHSLSIDDFHKKSHRCKKCVSKWRRDYYLRNKKKCLEYQKNYYELNKNSIVEKRKYYRDANKEYISKYKKSYIEENRNHILAYSKSYYEKNKDYIRERSKKYNQNNSDKINFYAATYRACKFTATPKWADLDKIKLLYKKAKWLEGLTGLSYHVDHVIPLQGENVCGLHVWENLQILEASLNIKKGNR